MQQSYATTKREDDQLFSFWATHSSTQRITKCPFPQWDSYTRAFGSELDLNGYLQVQFVFYAIFCGFESFCIKQGAYTKFSERLGGLMGDMALWPYRWAYTRGIRVSDSSKKSETTKKKGFSVTLEAQLYSYWGCSTISCTISNGSLQSLIT